MRRRWDPDRLKEHYDAVLKARDDETERTRQSMERRLEGMNEFRALITDLTGTFVTRRELRASLALAFTAVTAISALVTTVVYIIRP